MRKRSIQRRYREERRQQEAQLSGCIFCNLKTNANRNDEIVEATEFFTVKRNRYPYSIWNGLDVLDHLLIIPDKHTDALGELSDEALQEMMQIIVRYEKQEYSFYGSSPATVTKSVAHQHTHLIKLGSIHKKVTFHSRKPYILWTR